MQAEGDGACGCLSHFKPREFRRLGAGDRHRRPLHSVFRLLCLSITHVVCACVSFSFSLCLSGSTLPPSHSLPPHPLSCSLSSPLPLTPLFCPSLSLYPPPICAFQFLGSLSLSHSQLASFPRLVFLPTPSSPLTFFFLPVPRCIHAWDPAPQPDQTLVPHTPLIKSVT